ncbi:DUF427 domain-containing protein [Streptomyces roseus]|uniref:DUF427 domain-containing protein n=1 Tax=Streptomyces roseus TaxID=66430 RepID=A0A0J6XHJ5_9ACTN|nr:DUF427 domain-containing protein [Streptomyces roseus]KMO94639.1 hypothetical protein ACS04_28130 [Streptomyces roseus]
MNATETPGRPAESVWDYPRPPRVEVDVRHIVVEFAGIRIADTRRSVRVLETSHPPVFYIPPQDTRRELLRQSDARTYCEWKGAATHWDLCVEGRTRVPDAAWSYEQPSRGFIAIAGFLAFHPSRVDRCLVDDEEVLPQPGTFYGGWITSEINGPFKGPPGTWGW